MKKLFTFMLVILAGAFACSNSFSQSPQAFKYQAVLRNGNGYVIQNKLVALRISILQSAANGTAVYSERQLVTTNDLGLANVEAGRGSAATGVFSEIDWSAGPYFFKIELDSMGGTNYQTIGTSQLLSVPYALYSEKTNNKNKLVVVADPNLPTDSALFEVKDKAGQVIFAVYDEGVRIYVKNDVKGSRSGFAVGERNTGKAYTDEILRVSTDSVRIYINDSSLLKGARSGFAVGGRHPSKGSLVNEYLSVTPDSTRIYINDQNSKGSRGGFAVGGRQTSKGPVDEYLRVTPDSTRIYINESPDKEKEVDLR